MTYFLHLHPLYMAFTLDPRCMVEVGSWTLPYMIPLTRPTSRATL